MPVRKIPLVEGEIYHVFNKSIADYEVFKDHADYERMWQTLSYYKIKDAPCKFSLIKKSMGSEKNWPIHVHANSERIVQIIAYCLMPTHFHIVLKQLVADGVQRYVSRVLKSYSKYFNVKYRRRGPLWEHRYKNILVETNEQFLHLTRYVHLNPCTACLKQKPEEWQFSSYREYVGMVPDSEKICEYKEFLDMNSGEYQIFVTEHIDYQRMISGIKDLILE